ncbi:hypothetical protein TWF481_004796 [Arthrobotrys musiformis]|uniref:DUF7029 domain-containing protein n=1 Tax=Arthrobotrys musiformis TaxID=47236 RepID=A0AAV9WKT9_9PEZI
MVSGSLFLFALSSSLGLGVYADPMINLGNVPIVQSVQAQRRAQREVRGGVKLLPVREVDLFPHLRKRDNDLSVLHLRDSLTYHYGGIIEGQRTHIANVTVKKPDPDHPLILLEDIDTLTKSITCSGDKMKLEFKDENAMNYAIKQWDWVNEKTPDYFYLITFHQHEGCGQDDDRTSYRVSAVSYDKSTLVTTLTRERASWDETAQKFQLELSTLEVPPKDIEKRESNIQKRSLGTLGLAAVACEIPPLAALLSSECEPYKNTPTLSEVFRTVEKDALGAFRKKFAEQVSAGSGNFDSTVPAPWTFNWGDEKDDTTIAHFLGAYGSIEAEVKTACVGCYVKSNPTVNLKVIRNGDKADIDFVIKPNLQTKVDIGIQGFLEYSGDFNGIASAINADLESIGVGELVAFMPDISSGPGVELKSRVEADFDFGFLLDTKEGSIGLHIGDEVTVSATGWDTTVLKPLGDVRKLDGTAEINPYIRLGYGAGIEIGGGTLKYGAFVGWEAKQSWKQVRGKNVEEGCGDKVGFAFSHTIAVNVIYKVVIDPISKFVLDKIVSLSPFKIPELSGNIKEIWNPEPNSTCLSLSTKQLNIPARPDVQAITNEIKRQVVSARKGTSLTIRGADGKNIKYRLEEFTCKDGVSHLLPFNQATGGALFAWCDGREELDSFERGMECPPRSYPCSKLKAADRKEEPANQYEHLRPKGPNDLPVGFS